MIRIKTNLQERVVVLLAFFITAAHTEVKIRSFLTGAASEGILYSQYGFLIPIGLALILISMRLVQKDNPRPLSGAALSISLPFFLWFFAATLSFFWNIGTESVFKYYLGGFVGPLIIYLAFRELPLSKKLFTQIMIGFSLGIVTVLILGIIVYYQEWGIPGVYTLMFSRYNEARMKLYQQMTYGNLGHTAQLLVFISPVFLALAFDRGRSWLQRFWFGGVSLLCLINVAIVGARAGFVVIAVAMLLIFYFHRRLGRFLIVVALLVVAARFVLSEINLYGANLFLEHMINGITINQEADYSVMTRIEAMKEGWAVFTNNWLTGVGPGSTSLYISDISAHQMFIQQGAQLGILGLFATIILVLANFWRLAKTTFTKTVQAFRVERFVLLLGPAMFFMYGLLADLTLNIGVVNIWANLMAAFLALADFKEFTGDSFQSTVEKPKGELGAGQTVEGEIAPIGASPAGAPPVSAVVGSETVSEGELDNGGPDTSWQMRSG